MSEVYKTKSKWTVFNHCALVDKVVSYGGMS